MTFFLSFPICLKWYLHKSCFLVIWLPVEHQFVKILKWDVINAPINYFLILLVKPVNNQAISLVSFLPNISEVSEKEMSEINVFFPLLISIIRAARAQTEADRNESRED